MTKLLLILAGYILFFCRNFLWLSSLFLSRKSRQGGLAGSSQISSKSKYWRENVNSSQESGLERGSGKVRDALFYIDGI